MSTRNVTLSINSELYTKYRDMCKHKGLMISRQFEILMEKQLEEEK